MIDSKSDNQSYNPTQRAMVILSALCECGGLTALQLSIRYFGLRYQKGKPYPDAYCERLLKLLYDSKHIERIERYQRLSEGRKPYVYKLTTKGRRALAAWHGTTLKELPCREKDSRLSNDYIEHFMLINDFRVALLRAVDDATNGARIVTYHDDITLKSTHSQDKMAIVLPNGRTEENVILVPDGYFHLTVEYPVPWEYHRFLEIDRGTEIGRSGRGYDDWVRKVQKYRTYTKKNGFYTQRYGVDRVAILTITTSEKRLENLKQISQELGARNRFWFTTFDQLSPKTILSDAIWAKAGVPGRYAILRTTEDEQG